MKLEQALAATGAKALHDLSPAHMDLILGGACIDSRKAKEGDLFVCVQGEHSDGHDYAAQAVRAGAVAVLAERDPFENEVKSDVLFTPVLIVPNVVKALGLLARAWRDLYAGAVLGVTGSAGKTTVKEMLAHILSLRGSCAKNHLNLNNQLGLPLSILATSGKEEFWVMELGISQPEDMDELGPILAPDLAIILNVGPAHTQGLGAKKVAHYKSALLKYVTRGGAALISADYPDLVKESRTLFPGATYFSTTGKQLNYRASYLGLSTDEQAGDRGAYRLFLDGTSFDVTSHLTGPYGAENIIAAAAAAHMLGQDTTLIAQGIAEAEPPVQRFARKELPGWSIVDDSYNSNPLSSARMLEAVSELARDRDLVCVMGEMLELGDLAEDEHVALGRILASSGSKAVFWYGGQALAVQEGLKAEHYSGTFRVVPRVEDFLPLFREWTATRREQRDGLILFKGSRGNRLERLVNEFMSTGDEHAV